MGRRCRTSFAEVIATVVEVMRRGLTMVATVVALVMTLATPVSARVSTSRPLLPPHEPSRNWRLRDVADVLGSIDAARRSEEGLGPLTFDARGFARLSVPEQVFVVSNLERTSRGLAPAALMVHRLDLVASAAARRDADPADPGHGYQSNWSSSPQGYGQAALFADFGWMYDDGPPPQYVFRNVDCARRGDPGCWGHRVDILSEPDSGLRCPRELVTGTGYAPRSADGPSLTQIFEERCRSARDVVDFTWQRAVTELRLPPGEAGRGY